MVLPNELPADLPTANPTRLAVRVTKDAERQLRGGHPWVYDASIKSVSGDGKPGDLAVVFDADRKFVAIGLYDPYSAIRIKALQVGKPATIDAAWMAGRMAVASKRRAPLWDSNDTDAFRVIHGENDGLPGLVLDRYDATYVLKLYSAAWIPHLSMVIGAIAEVFGPTTMVLRLARSTAGSTSLRDGMALIGSVPTAPVIFRENGLLFEADVVDGQKTGHFLDQRENRALVRSLSAGRDVLDVFSCTGGFAVHAAAGGASSVHSVDISEHAIAAVVRNFGRNRDVASVRECAHTETTDDAFRVMDQLGQRGERFDLVVIDPPSFAQNQSSVEGGLRAYRKLTELGLSVLDRGGILVQASCSSRITADEFFDAVTDAARTRGVRLEELARTGHAIDHPIGFPQGAYLKAFVARRR